MLSFTGDTVPGIVDKFTSDDYGRYDPCVRGLWKSDALRAIAEKNRGNAGGVPLPQLEMLIFIEYEEIKEEIMNILSNRLYLRFSKLLNIVIKISFYNSIII